MPDRPIFMTRAALGGLGLSAADTEAFIATRVEIGVVTDEELITTMGARLSAAGRRRLDAASAAAMATPVAGERDKKLNSIELQIEPDPPMLAEKDYTVHISFHRQTDPELFERKEPFTLRGPNRFSIYDVSFEHLVHIKIVDDAGDLVQEWIMTPTKLTMVEKRQLVWRVTPPLGDDERIGMDGNVVFVLLKLETRQKAKRPTSPTIGSNNFQRRGRYQVIGENDFRFDGYTMSVAILDLDGVKKLKEVGVDTKDGVLVASAALKTDDAAAVGLLSNFQFRHADLDFDGRFDVDLAVGDVKTAKGWLWALVGPDVIYGFQPDTTITKPLFDVLIMLAGGLAADAGKDVPYDATEAALLARPDLFADDPGTSCKPFNNPGRILGERRFNTVLRVTQPKVAKAGSQPFYFEKQDKRPVDFPRLGVDDDNVLDYESDPSKFQAQTVAIGHVIEFAVRYRSNGYSLGDVAYSLTLAPRQKRRIMKMDFRRREESKRDEVTSSDDEVMDSVERDRDYTDAVESNLTEWSRGRSQASGGAVAAGIGGIVGNFVMGGGAVAGFAQSSASQEGGRNAAARERQQLRDAIRRYGQSLRSLESTVVTETEQTESIEGVSEVVQNINYTRSLSVIYYEILRHLRVDTEVAGVTECVFVPMPIKKFTDERISRHRRVLSRRARGWLERAVYRHLDDIQADFAGSDIPAGTRASHPLTELTGSVWLEMGIDMPEEGPEFAEINEHTDPDVYAREHLRMWAHNFSMFSPLLPVAARVLAQRFSRASDDVRERYFQTEIAPHMARKYLDTLELSATGTGVLDADFTLASRYRYGGTVKVDFTVRLDGSLTRNALQNMKLHLGSSTPLPARSYINLKSARVRFATDYYSGSTRSDRGMRDLLNSSTGQPDPSGGSMTFRLSSADRLNYRDRLKEGYQDLQQTLEANTFRYHKAIWWSMDRDELYTLLDGYAISDEDGRALASMVDRRPIGIQGNSMVFRIKTDGPVDTMFKTFSDLRNFYVSGLPPADPMRISLPTDGLYARAHMDDCIAAEEHDGGFDWVFDNQEPELADFPSNMFDSRRAEPQNLQPTKFPDSIISLQNAPAAPEVSGLSDILSAVQNGNAFRDITGLEGTQANLRAAMQGATSLATSFGNMALTHKLAQLESDAKAGKNLKAFSAAQNKAVKDGNMSPEAAKKNTEAMAKRQAEGEGKDKADSTAKNAEKIIDSEEGGTQVTATPDGVEVVQKNPSKPKKPDPDAGTSVIAIPNDKLLFLNFRTGKHSLRGGHVTALEILAGDVGLSMEDVVQIEGHASIAGSEASNEALGQRRAQALFEKLLRLVRPLSPDPDYSPAFVSSTGEEGSYREAFNHIDAVRTAPGKGHVNDPVEKAVLMTIQNETGTIKPPKKVKLGKIEITISGHFIFIENRIIVSTPQKEVKIVDRSTNTVVKDNVVNTDFSTTAGDVNVQAGPNGVAINATDGSTVNVTINQNTGKVEDVTTGPSAAVKSHDEWTLFFNGPEIENGTTLNDIIEELGDMFLSLAVGVAGNNTFDEVATEAASLSNEIESIAKEKIVEFILSKLGLSAIQTLLKKIQFGTIKFNAEIKVKENPDTKVTGKFTGVGMVIGSQSFAPSAVILHNKDYKTALKIKPSDWDDQGPKYREFGYVDNGLLPSIGALKAGLETLAQMATPLVNQLGIGVVELEFINKGIAFLQEAGAGPSVRFKAFSGDTGIALSGGAAGATGLTLQLVSMSSGQISFNDD